MYILGIETSCDETAVAIVEAKGTLGGKSTPVPAGQAQFRVLANVVLTQIPLHRKYGGVYPSLAKREHAKNLISVTMEALQRSDFLEYRIKNPSSAKATEHKKELRITEKDKKQLIKIFEREPELLEQFLKIIPTIKKPQIDAIAVTAGPGLEPALWVGVNFAKALALAWNLPVIPTNHMEGHALSALLEEAPSNLETGFPSWRRLRDITYPVVLLLVSGGHTELIEIKKPLTYTLLGATRDDAAGEAFDKTARLLGLPYPGGPEIAKLASECTSIPRFTLPRPMIGTENLDFSFSGLKTAVLYSLKKMPRKTLKVKREMSREIETAIADVLVQKTSRALEETHAKTLILGGGVTANKHIRNEFESLAKTKGFSVLIPAPELTTDNALMIALAGYLRAIDNTKNVKVSWNQIQKIRADGNWELTK